MRISVVIAAVVVATVALAGTVLAHERIEAGDYVFVIGRLEEPPLVGIKNAALVEIARKSDGSPVEGAEGALDAQIAYGGRTRDVVLRPVEGNPGSYAADFIPTRRGAYTISLAGQIADQPIDVGGEIEEVISAAGLEFPEEQPSVADLQSAIDQLRGDLGSARAFAVAGAALGAIGLALAGVALGRKRRSDS